MEALKRKRKNAETVNDQKPSNAVNNVDAVSLSEPPLKIIKKDEEPLPSTTIASGKSLPPDFFDKSIPQSTSEEDKPTAGESSKDIVHQQGELPKGFFDNPKEDAKARHAPFKNPMDEEWEKFQRVMAVESFKADNLEEEDLESFQVERDVDEIEEQLSSWAKIDKLQKKADELLRERMEHDKKANAKKDEDDTSDDEDFDFDSWRSKSTLKSKKTS